MVKCAFSPSKRESELHLFVSFWLKVEKRVVNHLGGHNAFNIACVCCVFFLCEWWFGTVERGRRRG